MAQTIKNLASGRLTADITAVATSLSVYVGEGTSEEIEGVWPDTPFYATIVPNEPNAGVPNSLDSEIVKITAVSSDQDGNTILTATRAQRDTLARAFSAGAIITNAIYVEDAGFSIYSTEEKVVGTWIDGKPIYRKSFSGTTFASGGVSEYVDLDSSSQKNYIRGYGVINFGGSIQRVGDVIWDANKAITTVSRMEVSSSSTFRLMATKNSGPQSYRVTIEYTKTTD